MKEMTGSQWTHDPNAALLSSSHSESQFQSQSQLQSINPPPSRAASQSYYSGRNVFHLLARREISPQTRHTRKRRWGESSNSNADYFFVPKADGARDARHGLFTWVEAESLQHLSAKYCPLVPPPRSTIAAAFSPDGKTLASTHGDHTVKIIDCQTGRCLKVLTGHRRTPWVVRFHPLYPEILASGSLDHEVRLWDANTSDCIRSRDFYRPIASIAFHAKGELLAVASGHKLFMWRYNERGEESSPTMVLKTRRSLRAVHFHPHGSPFLLTAEVNDLDSSDSSMTPATSLGYLHYPPPAVFFANVHASERPRLAAELPLMSLFLSSYARDDSRMDLQHDDRLVGSSVVEMESASLRFQARSSSVEQNDGMMFPMETSPSVPSTYHGAGDTGNSYFTTEFQNLVGDTVYDVMETTEQQPFDGNSKGVSTAQDPVMAANNEVPTASIEPVQFSSLSSCRDPTCWEIPFLQGWLIGQSQAGMPTMLPLNGNTHENSSRYLGINSVTGTSDLSAHNAEALASLTSASGTSFYNLSGRSSASNRLSQLGLLPMPDARDVTASRNNSHDGNDAQSIISRIQTELAASLATAAAAELPCTVKLRIWPHDVKNPCTLLHSERPRLTIPHAVLCSEMGAHFSPCGRYLAACVACMLPHMEADSGLQMQIPHDATGAATSPTRHPISAQQVMYELRVYSLEEATFGSVLVSRAIRAAHCLTSIQFSPTSEHILLAYGRRHSSLLKSIVIDGEATTPIYTILEIYRVSDMELVKVLSNAEDEVNVACFHPLPGGGLVYGTKEGKLRVLQYDSARGMNFIGSSFTLEENIVEIDENQRRML